MPHAHDPTPPAFYNDLNASLTEGWRLLAASARDRHAPAHTVAVATTARDGTPNVRTVVLRHADSARRQLRFHTDLRSLKIADLTAGNAVQVLAYDPAQKIQLRLSGIAVIHHGDPVAHAAWDASQPQSQLCYRQDLASGAVIADPQSGNALADHTGRPAFAAIVITVHKMDWLYLAASGHRRARYTWSATGVLTAEWLAP